MLCGPVDPAWARNGPRRRARGRIVTLIGSQCPTRATHSPNPVVRLDQVLSGSLPELWPWAAPPQTRQEPGPGVPRDPAHAPERLRKEGLRCPLSTRRTSITNLGRHGSRSLGHLPPLFGGLGEHLF